MSRATYYERNRDLILNRAKDCFENNKELLREREQKINLENYLKKKKMQKGNTKKTNIITCLMKKRRIKRISKKLS